jgi:hypothetical protein
MECSDVDPATTPIEQNHHLSKDVGTPVEKNITRYRLVGKLIYISHTLDLILHLQ